MFSELEKHYFSITTSATVAGHIFFSRDTIGCQLLQTVRSHDTDAQRHVACQMISVQLHLFQGLQATKSVRNRACQEIFLEIKNL